jgi:molybdopterin converting factor small subunit
VGDALDALFAQFPALRDRLTTDGQLSTFVNVYVNADDVRHRDGLATAVGETDTVILLPAMAGGAA